jgi:DNA-directed RNA polymerase specialized sigma24 family protein
MMSIDTMPAAQATEALIHQYGRLVFQVIYGLVGDWHESQDLTQDTFLAAFKAIEAARQASSANFQAKAWLMQIAANNARMSLRRRRLVRFVPFTALRKEEQEDDELVGERPAPVQPAGYGMDGTGQDPADLIAERDAVLFPKPRSTMKLVKSGVPMCRGQLQRARSAFDLSSPGGRAEAGPYLPHLKTEALKAHFTITVRFIPGCTVQ